MTSVLDTPVKLKKYRPLESDNGLNEIRSQNSLMSTTLTNDSSGYEVLIEDTQELLNTRKSLIQELKLDTDQINDPKPKLNVLQKEGVLDHHNKSLQISRKRAEKVRTIIQSYYDCIERSQKIIHVDESDHQTPLFPEVEGVFNPLQIIRNRRIRKKYNDKFLISPLGDYKPPSRVFSKYRTQHLIWQVNLNEYYNDIIWREGHWHELKNPRGELYYPLVDGTKQTPPKSRKLKRLHEQLFVGFDGEYNKEDDDTGDDPRLNSLPRNNESSASLARQEHYRFNSLKRTPGPTRSFRSDEELDVPNSRNSSIDKLTAMSHTGKSADSFAMSHFDDDLSCTSEMVEQMKYVKNLRSSLVMAELRMRTNELHLEDALRIKEQEIEAKLQQFDLHQTHIQEVSGPLQEVISKVDATLDRFDQFNNVKSVKIEELLGYCDRTNGEINTSITLRIRNIQEQKDHLTNTNDEWFFHLIYSCLENLIVMALWIVWIFVEFWRLIKYVFIIVVKLLKFIFL
ncbi:hypothetical protein OGAPHI_005531 [Ogataea philodendri]|uniref:Maintenance of telomere capping protein 4 n=1 Tax=Ogataea philodendri TaxID=1378263 RepID=A0A9P8NZ77_9ASCO|nr:uncharacterized protein OGAPHI_005531 [Ogataea philodendri]KAH3662282.1 hypothetical protein OGAPHI_005531 [Ogataea philodendri]